MVVIEWLKKEQFNCFILSNLQCVYGGGESCWVELKHGYKKKWNILLTNKAICALWYMREKPVRVIIFTHYYFSTCQWKQKWSTCLWNKDKNSM